ncbi:MAG: hypothetical protein U0166_17250 [Acidobacteriota bacterium]
MTLFWVILALIGAAIGNHLWAMLALIAFKRDVPCLTTERDLDHFRAAVARQMYAALLQIALLGGCPVLTIAGVGLRWIEPIHVVLLLPAWGVVLVMGLAGRRIEQTVRAIPVAEELRAERDAVVHTWRRRPIPDW